MKIGEIYTGIETGVEVEIVGFAGDLVKYEFSNPLEGFTGIQFCTKEDFEKTTQLRIVTSTAGNGMPAVMMPEKCDATNSGTGAD